MDASKYEYMDSAGTTMPTVRNAHMTTVEVPVFDARKVRSSVLAQGFELGFLERLDGSRCLDQVFKLTAVGSIYDICVIFSHPHLSIFSPPTK